MEECFMFQWGYFFSDGVGGGSFLRGGAGFFEKNCKMGAPTMPSPPPHTMGNPASID